MQTTKEEIILSPSPPETEEIEENSFGDDDDDDDDNDDDDDDDDDGIDESNWGTVEKGQREKLKRVLWRLSREDVSVRVHKIVVKGNSKTKESLILAELETLRKAVTLLDLIRAAEIANERLEGFQIFDAVLITVDSGPPELPGATNVIVDVQETKNSLSGDVDFFSNVEARSWFVEGSLKLKNLLGYGDIWDSTGSYGWDQTAEVSSGLSLPRFGRILMPVRARISLISQDWLKFSSYREPLAGFSVGLVSTRQHDLSYNLTWRKLKDPSDMSSKSIRRQLGHGLLSSMKYVYRLDRRDSQLRPQHGYAFKSVSQIGGLDPDSRSLRFIKQEFDFRYAFPLGFLNAAVNLGIFGGVVIPWGKGFMNLPTPLSQRFFMDRHSSTWALHGPSSLLGLNCRGFGPFGAGRVETDGTKKEASDASSLGRDSTGGDLAVTAFADLSFDLPLKMFSNLGIYGHLFVSTKNLAILSENELQKFSFKKFGDSFQSSVGGGIIVPTKLFRLEMNYCYVRQFDHDIGRTGIQFNFSSSKKGYS